MNYRLVSFYHYLGVSFVAAVMCLVASQASWAAGGEVLIVDLPQIYVESKVGKSLSKQHSTELMDLRKEVEKVRDKFSKETEKLDKQRSVLSPEALQKKAEDLQVRALAEEQKIQRKSRGLQKGQQNAVQEIYKVIGPIVKGIMEDHKAKMVVSKQSVIQYDESLDISSQVIKQLNGKLTSIKLSVEE